MKLYKSAEEDVDRLAQGAHSRQLYHGLGPVPYLPLGTGRRVMGSLHSSDAEIKLSAPGDLPDRMTEFGTQLVMLYSLNRECGTGFTCLADAMGHAVDTGG